MTDTVTAIELVKRYRGEKRPALDGPSFRVGEGEVLVLLGPAGAGKSTALGILATRIKPTQGRALVCGVDVVAQPIHARRLLALVPQRHGLDCALTARQNLLFHAAYHRVRQRSREQRADELLDSVGMTAHADTRVHQLTGDQSLRVSLARQLMHRPRVLLLDEPSVGLDPRSRTFLHDQIERLRADGVTTVLATQDPAQAARLCDHVAILDHGRLVTWGRPRTLTRPLADVHTLALVVDLRAVPASDVLTILSRMDSVTAVEQAVPDGAPARFRLACTDEPSRLLPAILEVLDYVGVRTRSAECDGTTLEEVLIDVTGKEPV